MFDSVALNVVIGLIFIYLLYSLLATVLSEIIATGLELRASNLKEAVNRMLTDENENSSPLSRLWDSLNILKTPNNPIINKFYNNPEIKYLGSSGIFKYPSTFKSVSFSKTLMIMLFGNETITKDIIDKRINEIINSENKELDKETAEYIKSLWLESSGDIENFKRMLEGWFDRTMEHATEWYKRKIQVILLILGFLMAWFFNANTFAIVHKLSNDKDAREKLVSMANSYMASNKAIETDTSNNNYSNKKLDSLLNVSKKLETDILKANSILGTGGWPPDSAIFVGFDSLSNEYIYQPYIDYNVVARNLKYYQVPSDTINIKGSTLYFNKEYTIGFITIKPNKIRYFFGLVSNNFLGFLITAIAISLGAPFWFDLLNKLMKLRTSTKEETDTPRANETKVQPVAISLNTQNSEGAVG